MNMIYQFVVIYGACALNEKEEQAIKHILSDYKTMKHKLNIISEICVDNSKQHINDKQSIIEIIKILQGGD